MIEVDVRGDESAGQREALRLGEALAVLVDERLAVPGEIRGRFAGPCGRVQVGGDALRRLCGADQAAIVGLADGDVAGGEIGEHRCAGERGERGRRQRHPQVLADLGVQHEALEIPCREQQARTEGHVLAGDPHRAGCDLCRGCEVPLLVKLTVVGQVALRHRAQHAATLQHERAVEHAIVGAHRQPDHQQGRQVAGGVCQRRQRGHGGVEQGVLLEQVLVGVGRDPELGKEGEHGALVAGLPGEFQGLPGVELRGGDPHLRRADRHSNEAVAIDRIEFASPATTLRMSHSDTSCAGQTASFGLVARIRQVSAAGRELHVARPLCRASG